MAGPQSGEEDGPGSEFVELPLPEDEAAETQAPDTDGELRRLPDISCRNLDCYEEPPPPPAKKGHVDGVTLTNGHAELRGWTCQPGRVQLNDVHVYVGGPAGIGHFVVGTTANATSEAWVAAQCGLSGSTYRYAIPLFDDFRQQHPGKALYVYAISPVGGPVLLGNSGSVTVPAIVNDADLVAQTAPPATMLPGSTATVRVQMRNTGNTVWTAGTGYRLGAQNPIDNTHWGTKRVNLAADVAPGATATFDFTARAPATAGVHNFQWRMVRDGVAWFGPNSTNVAVNVVTGTITAAPNPCTIPWGGTACTVNFGWNSNVASAEVWVTTLAGANPALFARAQHGTAAASWVTASGARFHLKAGGWSALTLATIDVRGTPTVNTAPTVTLTAPTNGQSFTTNSTITLSASASDADDGLARVEFLVGGTKVGEDASAPYTHAWTPGDGTHAVSARAIDTRGAQTTSTTASITVAPPPPRKDGSISWYGDRNQDAAANRPDGYFNNTAPDKTGFALSWAQTRPAGAGTGEHLLSEVRYTGRAALPGQSTGASAPYAKVIFNYAALPANAWRRGYASGGVLTQSRRLASITSCNSAAAGCATSDQARFYQLTYNTSVSGSGAELLTHVQECRDSTRGVCLPATTFAWSGASNVLSTSSSWDPGDFGSTLKYEGLKLGDIDGDGRQDLVWLKDGSSGETCPTEHVMVAFGQLDGAGRQTFSASVLAACTPNELMSGLGEGSWQLFDYTGDGRDDLFVAGNGAWMMYPSQGRTAQPFNTSVNLLAGIHIPVQLTSAAGFHPQLTDLNGDGLHDVLYRNGDLHARLMERAGGSWRWGAERRATFRPEPPPECSSLAIDGCTQSAPILREPRGSGLNDFNGDAASDLVFTVHTHWRVQCYRPDHDVCTGANRSSQESYVYGVSRLTATTIEFGRQGTIPLDPSVSAHTVLGDFNGDGLTDMASGANGLWRYSLNSGAGFLPTEQLGSFMYPELVKAADVNGDGRSDLLFIQPDAYNVARYYVQHGTRSGGLGAVEAVPGTAACFNTGCDPRSVVNLFLDLDADGGMDYFAVRVFNDRSEFYLAQPATSSRGKPRDAIVSITNGLGARTELTYATLNNPGVHVPDTGARDANNWGRGAPVRDFKAPGFVVAQAASSSPQAGLPDAMARLHYRYAGAKVQAGGRGFLGFREIATIDPNRTGGYVVTTTTYSQNFPFAGMPASTVKRVVANQAYAPSACIAQPIANGCYATPGATLAPLGGNWLSAHTQLWEGDTDSAGTTVVAFAPGVQAPIHVRTAGTEESVRDPFLGVQTTRVVTTFDYGSHGNVSATTVETFEGTSGSAQAIVATANTYGDNATLWRLGRLTGTTVTHRRPNAPDVVRTTAFDYAMGGAATGLLTSERLQPGTPLELRKEFAYDDYGNKRVAAMCAAPATGCGTAIAFQPAAPEAVQRYGRTMFDSNGRFPVATIEPFANGEHATQTVFTRDMFGGATHAQDANGLDTIAISGALGRAYYSWIETVPGSVPGAGNGGAEQITTYRWCGSGVTCPAGARFRSRTLSDAAPTAWTYFDLLGRPILQATETFNIDVSGQDVVAVCTAYDASGQPLRVSNPFFLPGKSVSMDTAALANQCNGRAYTVSSFDLLGRPTDVQSPDGAIVSTGYAGLRTLMTDARGHTTTETRNGKGELVAVTDADGFTQTYSYNADGSLAATTRDAGGGQIVNAFAYDVLGRKTVQDDPDSGVTHFTYNALGELIAQVDAVGNRIENDLDARGRVWRRTVRQSDGTIESRSTFAFDTAGAIGAPADEMIGGNYTLVPGTPPGELAVSFERRYRYDSLGRPSGATTTVDGTDYLTAVQYDVFGRAWKVQDASGRWARTQFNARGMAMAVCNSNAADTTTACPYDANTYQRTLATDVWGKTVRERRGNSTAMDVVRTHRGDNGRLQTLCAGNTACALVDEGYTWDANGNLQSHLKEGRYLEAFEYDRLNRLTRSTAAAAAGGGNVLTHAADYDALGNACSKSFDGTMRELMYAGRSGCSGTGGATGPHQVTQVQLATGTAQYHYDARGNQTLRDLPGTANDRTIHYTADNQAREIALGNGVRARFWYGSDGQRYKREDGGRRTLYLGNLEIVIDGGVVTTRRNVAGVLMQTIVGGMATNRYLFHDRLGNVVKVTDAAGAVLESHDFQPFGERRNPNDPDATTAIKSNFTTRGFTGHEMVDGLGVIHMNGRIYDPDIGRFLQPDPVIQAPGNPQSWNAYTYVFNNPLTYTDPSGMIGVKERQWAAGIIAIGAAVWTGGASAGWWAGAMGTEGIFAVAMAASFASGAVATQSTKGGLQAAFGAALTFGVASGLSGWQAVVGHAVTGGIMESLQGGQFGHGFAAAGVTALVMPVVHRIDNHVARTTVGAIVGGSLSEASGGKFANGAMSGAIQAAMAGASNNGMTREQRAAYAEQAKYDPETALAQHWVPPALPQEVVDGVAGFGDTLSFGFSKWARNQLGSDAVDYDSGSYAAGEAAGVVYSTAFGGLAGLRAAGTAGRGLEFSHWIPARMGGPRTVLNGNYVTTAKHALSDPYRYRFMPRTWKYLHPKPHTLIQQWHRAPYVWKGTAAGGGAGPS